MSVERKNVGLKDCWNVSSLISSFDEWNRKFELMRPKEPKNGLLWPEINSYRGRLHEGPGVLKECLEKMLTLSQELEKLYTYAHLRHDEEITLDENKTAYDKVTSLLHDFQKEMAWFEPEVLALPQTQLETYLNSPELRPFKFHLEKLIRLKPHVLSSEMEELMALSGKALQASHKAFRAISDADFNFGKVEDGSGQLQELTHGSFSVFLRSTDRILRENAFKQMYKTYSQYENTLCELLNGQVQAHLFQAKSRGYASCLEAALFPKNIDTSVYHALIEAVHKKIGALHKYIALRKKLLKVDELHLYDMYVPLVPNLDLKIPYEKAEEFVIESAAPLGKKYQEILSKGLREEGWVDRYENKNKRSGAYSSGCYGSHPFILMNYKDLLRDVFTLAHEAGHSMHSYLSRSSQPYHYAD